MVSDEGAPKRDTPDDEDFDDPARDVSEQSGETAPPGAEREGDGADQSEDA